MSFSNTSEDTSVHLLVTHFNKNILITNPNVLSKTSHKFDETSGNGTGLVENEVRTELSSECLYLLRCWKHEFNYSNNSFLALVISDVYSSFEFRPTIPLFDLHIGGQGSCLPPCFVVFQLKLLLKCLLSILLTYLHGQTQATHSNLAKVEF